LNERCRDDPSTHPDVDLDLWLKVRSFNGSDRNRVYRFSNITAKNLRTTHSASTIGCSELIPSTQTSKLVAMLDQQMQTRTCHLNEKCEKYKQLTDDYEELCRSIMEIES